MTVVRLIQRSERARNQCASPLFQLSFEHESFESQSPLPFVKISAGARSGKPASAWLAACVAIYQKEYAQTKSYGTFAAQPNLIAL
jgi:hypothetical protein